MTITDIWMIIGAVLSIVVLIVIIKVWRKNKLGKNIKEVKKENTVKYSCIYNSLINSSSYTCKIIPKRPIKIIHIGRSEFIDNIGVITIITEVFGDNLRLGFAFCAPNDRFNKKIGRKVAFKDLFRFNGKCLVTKFTGHSSEDIVRFFNDEMDISEKPYRWRNIKFYMRDDFTLSYYRESKSTEYYLPEIPEPFILG